MVTKMCNKCGRDLPIENFRKNKSAKDGHSHWCKECLSENEKQFRIKHRDKLKDKQKQRYSKNKDKLLAAQKEYREQNKEKVFESKKRYYEKNREKILEQNRKYRTDNNEALNERRRQNRINNNEHICKVDRMWRKKNKAKISEANKKYQSNNLEKYRITKQKRDALRRQLPATLTIEQWEETRIHFDNACSYCGLVKPLEQDHYIPLSKMGEYSKSNIVPACKSCNCSKGNRMPKIWYKKQPFYSKAREKKILDFLGYNGNIQQLKLG